MQVKNRLALFRGIFLERSVLRFWITIGKFVNFSLSIVFISFSFRINCKNPHDYSFKKNDSVSYLAFEVLLGALTPSLVLSSEGHYLAAAWFITGCCSLHLEILMIVITTQPLLGSQSPFWTVYINIVDWFPTILMVGVAVSIWDLPQIHYLLLINP